MSNVALSVGGRSYTVNCAEGEEGHIAELGQMIDAKLSAMGTPSQNETRNLLFAALLLADEVFELQANGPAAQSSAAAPLPAAAQESAVDPERLAAIADRLENLASHLEG